MMMNPFRITKIAVAVAIVALALAGCRSMSDLEPAPPNTDPVVFDDNFGNAVDYQAFLGSKLDAVSIDPVDKAFGAASLKVVVPAGGWSGGAFTTGLIRDLSGYTALTFYAKSSKETTLDVAGLGNDNTGTSKYTAEWQNIPITTAWTKYIIPIPLPSKLTREGGLLFFAEASEGGEAHDLWFDEVKFETVGGITNPRPAINTQTVNTFVGATVEFEGTRTVFEVNGSDQTIRHMSNYFNFNSSNEDVAVATGSTVEAVGPGTAVITADLNGITAVGSVTLEVADAPTVPAPTPTHPASDVISLFSNVYTPGVTVDSWLTEWSFEADYSTFEIDGDDVKVYVYSNMGYAGIDFATQMVDATSMDYFHIDVYVPAGSLNFKVKLVDFGPNGVSDWPAVGDDTECELVFWEQSVPPLVAGTWTSLEIPLDDFMGPGCLAERGHLAQLIIAGWSDIAFVDNIYFHK
jgi:hypothetical protein